LASLPPFFDLSPFVLIGPPLVHASPSSPIFPSQVGPDHLEYDGQNPRAFPFVRFPFLHIRILRLVTPALSVFFCIPPPPPPFLIPCSPFPTPPPNTPLSFGPLFIVPASVTFLHRFSVGFPFISTSLFFFCEDSRFARVPCMVKPSSRLRPFCQPFFSFSLVSFETIFRLPPP